MSNAAAIANLKAILAKGVLTVEADGRRVTYASRDALRAEIAQLEAEDAATAQGGATYATTLAVFGDD